MSNLPIHLNHLLKSNNVPRIQDTAFVQQEIDCLASQIRVLEARHREHKAILSTVRKLPPELLGRIFYFTTAYKLGYMGLEERDDLRSICVVCRSWYNAALHTPELWGHLQLDSGTPESEAIYTHAAGWLSRVNQASRVLKISRWGPCECSVDYDFRSDLDQEDVGGDSRPCDLQSESLAALLTSGPALDTLHVDFQSSMCFAHLIKGIHNIKPGGVGASWDSIRSLFLNWDGDGYWIEVQDACRSFFRHLPSQLKSLNLFLPSPEYVFRCRQQADSLQSEYSPLLLHIPPSVLEGLTSLTISAIWPGPCALDVLQHCKKLKTLCVRYDGLCVEDKWWENTSVPIIGKIVQSGIVLPHLQTLELLELDPTSAGDYLPYLHVPSLASLTMMFRLIWNQEKSRNGILQGVNGFLASLGAQTPDLSKKIRTLKIGCEESVEEVDTHALVEMLADLTSLSHLALKYIAFDARLLKTLIPSPFLPHLHRFELLSLPAEFNLEGLFDFVYLHHDQPARGRQGGQDQVCSSFECS